MNVFNPRPKCEVNSFIEWIMGLDQWARGCNHTPLPSKHMLQMSKESTALFLRWESQTPLKKKKHPGTGCQVRDPCLFQPTSPSLTPKLPFLLSGAVSSRGVSALSQSRAGECGGGASAQSNPVCGIIQIEAMPFQDCWTGLVSMLQIAGRQVTQRVQPCSLQTLRVFEFQYESAALLHA